MNRAEKNGLRDALTERAYNLLNDADVFGELVSARLEVATQDELGRRSNYHVSFLLPQRSVESMTTDTPNTQSNGKTNNDSHPDGNHCPDGRDYDPDRDAIG